VFRDITDVDPGRGPRWIRLAVVGVAAAVVIGASLVATRPGTGAPVPLASPGPLPRSAGLLGATFADSHHGWLLTAKGIAGDSLWRSDDGGSTWALAMRLPAATSVGSMKLGPNGTGYVATLSLPQGAGRNGFWLTTDGGRTFAEGPLPSPTGYLLLGLSSAPDGSAHALYSDEDFPPTALVFERQPANGDWTLAATLGPAPRPAAAPPAEPIPLFGSRTGFAFLDEAHGVIATQTDIAGIGAYRTTDGGRSWAYVRIGPPPNGELLPPAAISLSVFDGILLLAVAFEAGTVDPAIFIYRSSDGGATWGLPVGVPAEDGLETPAFNSPGGWWVPYGTAVEVSADAGESWQWSRLNLPGATTVRSIYPVDQLRAWAFGGGAGSPAQFLFRTVNGGLTWTAVKPPG